ncbi:MAG: hypothetical protein NZ839_00200 [Endomicrobia bacterium]|nr:hypothetical protein [Endomicrobiia bacterium]
MKNIIYKNCFYDSIFLMQLSQKLSKKFNSEITLMMGTETNKGLLKERGMLTLEGQKARPNDLIICCGDDINTQEVLRSIHNVEQTQTYAEAKPSKIPQDVNILIVSIPGEFVYYETKKIMENLPSGQNKILGHDLCLFVFSDNVPLEEEIFLKKLAVKKNVLFMGPDCGSAIINGIGLGFSNVVKVAKENEAGVGIISAGGSGLQAISCMIDNFGYKITEAVGVGGRDLSDEVGGITTIESIKVLEQDKRTKVIILFSKPPSEKVVKKIVNYLKNNCKKRYIVNFLGSKKYKSYSDKIKFVTTTYEAVTTAIQFLSGKNIKKYTIELDDKFNYWIKKMKKTQRQYVRGVYSGGSLCDEAMVVLKNEGITEIYSNVPLEKKYKLLNPWKSIKNTIVDLGDDIFTRGKPHPMIDFTFRKERILKEAEDNTVAVIMFDIILGFGAHPDPVGEIKDTLIQAQKICNSDIIFSCCIVGTRKDPQKLSYVKKEFEKIGVIVFNTNVEMAKFVSKIIKML